MVEASGGIGAAAPAAGRRRAARGRRAAGDPGLAAGQRAGRRHRAAGAALGPAGRHPRHRRADAGPRLYRLGRRTRRRHRRRADQAPGAPGPVRAPGGQGAALEPGPGLGRAGQRRGGPGRGAGWLLRQIPAGHGRRRHAAGGIFRVAVSGGCDRGPGAADHRAADSLVHGPGRLGRAGREPAASARLRAAVRILRRPSARAVHAQAVRTRRGRGRIGGGRQRRIASAHPVRAAHRLPVLGGAGVLRRPGRRRGGRVHRADLSGFPGPALVGADLAGRHVLPVDGARGLCAAASVRRALP